MYRISFTNKFKKDYKLCKKRGYPISELEEVLKLLAKNGKLPLKYKPHVLKGNYTGLWECHIKPDWLLIWLQNENELTLLLTRTGTHSDLFSLFFLEKVFLFLDTDKTFYHKKILSIA